MPLCLELYSTEHIGLIVVIWAVLGYFGLLDLGLSRAVTFFVATQTDRSGGRGYGQLIGSGVLLAIAIGIPLAASLWLSCDYVVQLLVGRQHGLASEMKVAVQVAAVSLPLILVSTILRGALEGISDFRYVSMVKLALGSALFGAPIIAYPLGGTLALVTGVIAAARLIAIVIYGIRISKLMSPELPELRSIGAASNQLIRYGGWLSVSYFIVPILVYVDRFFISNALGPEEVAFYGIPHEILLKSAVFPASIVLVLFPAFVQGNLQSDRSGVRDQYQSALAIISSVMFVFSALIILSASPILSLWLGQEFANRSTLAVQIIGIGCYASALMRVPLIHIQASGQPQRAAFIHILELPIFVLIVLPLAVQYGINGIAVAWAGRSLVDFWMLLGQSRLVLAHEFCEKRVLIAVVVIQPAALAMLLMAEHLSNSIAILSFATVFALASLRLTATPNDISRLKKEIFALFAS